MYGGAELSNQLILGLDIGTSSLKALFIDIDGRILHKTEEKIATDYQGSARAEQNAMDYLTALRKIAAATADLSQRVVAVGLSGHTPSVVCIDEHGDPVRPVMTWQDNRAREEAVELKKYFDNPLETVGTSLPWSASACPAKLFWLSRHEPEIREKVRWVLQPKDFIGFHLTGRAISDPWSTKGICNVLTKSPILNLLDFVGWSPEISPELMDGFESRGEVSHKAGQFFGLPEGIPVSVGWSDAMSGMVAMGVMTEPTSFIITGTSAIVGSSSATPPSDGGQLYVIPTACSPLSVTYGPTQSSGSSIEWASQLLSLNSTEFIEEAGRSELVDLPIYLPYIDGERAPLWRPDLRGGFYGVGIQTKRADIAAAVLEGICLAERQVVDNSEELTGSVAPSIKLGGHAGNDWRGEKFRLRTLGRSIDRYEDTDTTTRGSAILAHAILTGDLTESTRKLASIPKRSEPSDFDRSYAISKYAEFKLAQRHSLDLANYKAKQNILSK